MKRKEVHLKYGEIGRCIYDKEYYYLNVNNEELHILPMRDFTMGTRKHLKALSQGTRHKDLMPVNLSLKEKYQLIKMTQAAKKVNEDREWEEWKANRKKRK